MSKKSIIIVLLLMLMVGVISLYTTFAIDEEAVKLNESTADRNLIYSIKQNSNQKVVVGSKEEKYLDITLTNIYESAVRYGTYYYLVSPESMPDNVEITVIEESVDLPEDTIEPNETKSISVKVANNSDYPIELILGAIVGFENGEIEDLVEAGEVLIK